MDYNVILTSEELERLQKGETITCKNKFDSFTVRCIGEELKKEDEI